MKPLLNVYSRFGTQFLHIMKKPVTFSLIPAVALAVCLTFVMASSALAVNQETRSEEMRAHALCYQAGTVQMFFTETDWNLIAAEIAANGCAEIRIALKGIPMKRPGRPHEVPEVVSFLAFKGSYVTGAVIRVDGGIGI